jgi:hypothetical protein
VNRIIAKDSKLHIKVLVIVVVLAMHDLASVVPSVSRHHLIIHYATAFVQGRNTCRNIERRMSGVLQFCMSCFLF